MDVRPRPTRRGFSMTETMVALGVIAIGVAIAIPGFRSMDRANRARQQLRQFKIDVAYTHGLAVRSGSQSDGTTDVTVRSAVLRITDKYNYEIVVSDDASGVGGTEHVMRSVNLQLEEPYLEFEAPSTFPAIVVFSASGRMLDGSTQSFRILDPSTGRLHRFEASATGQVRSQ